MKSREKKYKRENAVLDEDEIDLCLNLKSGNCKPSQIKRVLVEKYNKELTIQKLKNILNNLPKTDNQEGDVDFEEFFTNVEEEGGFVDWEEDPDGTLKCMAFASRKMKEASRTSDPPLIQLDTTFEVEEARYKLMAAVYINPTTNKSEVGFMAVLLTFPFYGIFPVLRGFGENAQY